MNPIRIVPWEHLNQPFCPICFGLIKKVDSGEDLYQCSECHQYFSAPDSKHCQDESTCTYLTFRIYFRYKHLKNVILHVAHNRLSNELVYKMTCDIDGKCFNVETDISILKDFVSESHINFLMQLSDHFLDDYSCQGGKETIHLLIYQKECSKRIMGNFDIIEILPEFYAIISLIYNVAHKLIINLHSTDYIPNVVV